MTNYSSRILPITPQKCSKGAEFVDTVFIGVEIVVGPELRPDDSSTPPEVLMVSMRHSTDCVLHRDFLTEA